MSPIPLRTSALERIIDSTTDQGLAELAADELAQMRDVVAHLGNHLVATKRQTDHSVAALQSVIHQFQPDPPAHFARRLA